MCETKPGVRCAADTHAAVAATAARYRATHPQGPEIGVLESARLQPTPAVPTQRGRHAAEAAPAPGSYAELMQRVNREREAAAARLRGQRFGADSRPLSAQVSERLWALDAAHAA